MRSLPAVHPIFVRFQDPLLTDDSLRAVIDTVLSAPAYQWSDSEPRLGWLARWWRTLVDWLGRFQEANPTAADILFWSLVALLVLIFLHGGWIMYLTVRGASAVEGRAGGMRVLTVRDERWYRQQAERLATEGRLTEAMQAVFTALVLHLEAGGILRYHPSKTPREYAREARLGGEARARLDESVREFYAHAYAGEPASLEQYRAWVSGLQRDWHAAPS